MTNMNESGLPFGNPIIPGDIWAKNADYSIPVVSPIGRGPKGDTFKPEDLTDQQIETIGRYAVAMGAKGDKGDKGDTGSFTDLTEEQLHQMYTWFADGNLQPELSQYSFLFQSVNGVSENILWQYGEELTWPAESIQLTGIGGLFGSTSTDISDFPDSSIICDIYINGLHLAEWQEYNFVTSQDICNLVFTDPVEEAGQLMQIVLRRFSWPE